VQVVSHDLACFRVVESSVAAGQFDFRAEFDSRQLHNTRPAETLANEPG
jgi:hypothetical protein